MNSVVMMFFGAGIGMGLILLAQALKPTSQPIADVFRSVVAEGQPYASIEGKPERSVRDILASIGAGLATATNDEAQLHKDLAVANSSLEQHGLVKAGAPALTLIGIYVVWLFFAALGIALSPLTISVVAIGAALIAFVVPDQRLRSRAKVR